MKKIIIMAILFAITACGEKGTVRLPDLGPRVTVLENNDAVQDMRLYSLELRASLLESGMNTAESDIDSLEVKTDNLQKQLDDVESRLTSVIYPCGVRSQEILLKTQDGIVAYFQEMGTEKISFSDTVTIPAYTIPTHLDKFCKDTNFWNGECTKYSYRSVGAHTIPAKTYSVGDSATISFLKKAYLGILNDGNYQISDGFSCNFTISNGEVL